jgi:hypothetical protein
MQKFSELYAMNKFEMISGVGGWDFAGVGGHQGGASVL